MSQLRVSSVTNIGGTGSTYAPGHVVQVVSVAKTDVFTTSSLTYIPVTGLSATITPKSATSTILVIVQIAVGGNAGSTNQGNFKVTRGGTDFYLGNADGSRTRAVFGGYTTSGLEHNIWSHSIIDLDSPASTSALTYQVETMVANSFGTSRVNRSGNDGDSNTVARGASSITLMEIAQ
jgi:hypothetical protein